VSIKKGIDIKLNVKPAYIHLIHQEAYEGPCRTASGEKLTKEYDIKTGKEKFNNFKETLKTTYSKEINMLEPSYLTWTDDFIFHEKEINKLMKDFVKTDIFLIDGVFFVFPASEIAIKTKKAVGIVGGYASTDGVASLRTKGLEAYGFIDHDDANRYLELLRSKKAINNTKVLVVLKDVITSKGVLSTITNLENLNNDLGVHFVFINAEEILDEVQNLNKEELNESKKITNELILNAEKNYMDSKYIFNSVKFYVTVKKMLEKYECNAFTIPCFEICRTKRLDKEKYTFCLAHSLLKEEGIPSSCEADINVLMAINVLISLTKKAPHMGNVHPLTHEFKTDQSTPLSLESVKEIEGRENIVSVWHAVPTRKMKGIDKEMMPYRIQSFTHSGWGATIRYDFNRDKGETITLLRFHPTGKKMLAVKGEIVAGAGLDTIGCATGVYYQVNDVKDFFKKQLEFGHHFAWVYGDYIEKIKDLGDILGIEVITA